MSAKIRESLDLLLKRKRSLSKRVISLFRNQTLPQICNAAKFKTSEFRGFNPTYLKYEPFRLVLFITFTCNFSCGWCSFGSPGTPIDIVDTDEMEMDTFKYMVNRFNRALWLELSGGAPFLHSRIFEMIDYAHERRMRTKIPTNGVVLHDILERVARSPLLHLNISLNACDRDEFSQLHGCSKCTYDRLLLDIRTLIKKRNSYKKGLK